MDVIEAIKARRDTTHFKPTPIPDQKLHTVLNAARLAPSAENAQPWKFVVVHDEDLKRKLVNVCYGQKCIIEAPTVIVAFALLDQSSSVVGGFTSSYPMDVAFALGNIMLAATAEGLGSCFVHRFQEEEIREILGAPSDARTMAIIPLGIPNGQSTPPGSKHFSEIVSYNSFD